MRISIRNFLLVNILLAIVFITSLSAMGDYYLSQKDIHEHMDGLLAQMGISFMTVISNNLDKVTVADIQKELQFIQNKNQSLQKNNRYFSREKYYFQLWDNNNQLVLYSDEADKLHLNAVPEGFSDIKINNEIWRVFKQYDAKRHLNFIVGERYDIRNQLLHQIAINNFYIMLLTYPISALLIWTIVGWGFKSLHKITGEVSNRAPTYLEPVDARAEAPIEIKPLIDELNNLFARLHEAFEREKRFAGDAAHELRTPLAALKTQAQVALKTTDNNERQILLQNVIANVDRIVHIVQQLLTLSRLMPEAASIYDITEVNLPKLTAEIIAQLVPMALAKKIDIELDAPSSPIHIKGNLTGLSILIRNLVDNAIRYTPENGQVKVEVKTGENENKEKITLTVTDSGPGIPEELRARVFERFYRVIGNNASGSGLGLAIVQQIAQLHHATIALANTGKNGGLRVEIKFIKYHPLVEN